MQCKAEPGLADHCNAPQSIGPHRLDREWGCADMAALVATAVREFVDEEWEAREWIEPEYQRIPAESRKGNRM